MSDDPEEGSTEWWREIKEEKQRRRGDNARAGHDEVLADRLIDWTMHKFGHYSVMLQGHKLQYWPSTNKWNWKGRTYNGRYADVKGFVRNRLDNPPAGGVSSAASRGETETGTDG